MDLQWVAGVTVAGNILTGLVPDSPGAQMYSAIALGNCRDIMLHGNAAQNAAGYNLIWWLSARLSPTWSTTTRLVSGQAYQYLNIKTWTLRLGH
jgi:hypothetical protein